MLINYLKCIHSVIYHCPAYTSQIQWSEDTPCWIKRVYCQSTYKYTYENENIKLPELKHAARTT